MSAEIFIYNLWFKLWLEPLDNFISYFYLTSHEEQNLNKAFSIRSFTRQLWWFLIALTMSPFGIALYIAWFIIFRKVLRNKNYKESFKESKESLSLVNTKTESKTFEILSINVCLLPESLSRQNNLCQTEDRLVSLGNVLNKSEPNTFCYSNFNTEKSHNDLSYLKNLQENQSKLNEKKHEANINVKIIDNYVDGTDTDFVCLQEVWTIDMAIRLKEILHEKYPFIIYDAGTKNFKSNKYIGFESGLLTASKYPIMNADFKQYTTKSGLCCYTSKGLLVTKVI